MNRFTAAIRWAWCNRPLDLLVAWMAVAYVYGFLTASNTPLSRMHVILNEVMPIQYWAVFPAIVLVINFLSLHTSLATRKISMMIAGAWWTFVAACFLLTDLSATAWGPKLALGVICFMQAVQEPQRA